MSEHTPGTWAAVKHGEFFRVGQQGPDGTIVFPIATVGSPCDPNDPKSFAVPAANARLIASSPDLLEACRRLLGVVEQLTLDSPLISDGHTAAKFARAALAKATGGQP